MEDKGDGRRRQKELDQACGELDAIRLKLDNEHLFRDMPEEWWDEQIAEIGNSLLSEGSVNPSFKPDVHLGTGFG